MSCFSLNDLDDIESTVLWYRVRDMFLGRNYTVQDIHGALELAKTCRHPDAQWLCKVFEHDADVVSPRDAYKVLSNDFHDERARSFAHVLNVQNRLGCALAGPLLSADTVETPFALSLLCGWFRHDQLRRKAADLGEPDALFLEAKNAFPRRRELFLVAAQLGHVESMSG